MIQRQQTLWLLLSAICALLSYWLPFYSGTKEGVVGTAFLKGGSTFLLLIFTGLSTALALFTIFLYKDRKTQFRLCLGGIVVSVLIIIFYFSAMKKFSGSISLSCLIVLAMLVGYIMAAYRIRKDERLMKSLERLR